ncbi:ATP synthase F0 subunit B [Candidatus Moduliflexota bacterium]
MAIFLAFVFYLNTFLLKPLGSYLRRRKETIENLRAAGGDQDSTLEQLQKDYRQKIDAARETMLEQRTTAKKEAVDIQNSILDEAKKEAGQELSTAEAELAEDAAAARQRLSGESSALAAMITEKVLGRVVQ